MTKKELIDIYEERYRFLLNSSDGGIFGVNEDVLRTRLILIEDFIRDLKRLED